MKRSILLGAAFAALLVVIGASAIAMWRNTTIAQDRIARLQTSHAQAAGALVSIRSAVYLNGILVRDYLLDANPEHAQDYIDQFSEIRAQVNDSFRILRGSSGETAQREALDRLWNEIAKHFDPTEVMLDWSPEEKQAQRNAMLRQRLRRREEVFALAEQVEQMMSENYSKEQQRIRTADQDFRASLAWTSATAVLLGLIIAGFTFGRMMKLERESELASEELRRLSRQIRTTQEQERTYLSRELHDQVGQMLTGLKMELANIAKIHGDSRSELSARIAQAKGVAEQTLRIVRNIAMLLRPSMLDDLGLSPALAWLIKEVSKSSGFQIHASIDPAVDSLPDSHRTCVYRVVQEALTNAVRYSKGDRVEIELRLDADSLRGAISDNGHGFEPGSVKGKGLGLSGMAERIKELRGSLNVTPVQKSGVRIEFRLPRPFSFGGENDSNSVGRRSRNSSGRIETSA